MQDISFDSDEKRAAVRSMLENWPQPGGIVCLTPRQMLAILDAHERTIALVSRLRGAAQLVVETFEKDSAEPVIDECPHRQSGHAIAALSRILAGEAE
jgi:hypothetical protein